MVYSLTVVQPAVAEFFTDGARHEEFVVTLAHGNRWPVVGLIAGLILTGAAAIGTQPRLAAGFGVALVGYLLAAAVFADVSWRHWPARLFALADELPAYRRALRLRAWTILTLVGVAYLSALVAGLGVGLSG
jgi:hypothetical protein